jgi:hypothetical protein
MNKFHGESTNVSHPLHASRGFAQSLGLHPLAAFVTVACDGMLFSGEIVTMGLGLIISLPVSVALGYIAYHTQINLYGDEPEAAKVKACAVALLTAVPTALPSFITMSMGFVGLFRRR